MPDARRAIVVATVVFVGQTPVRLAVEPRLGHFVREVLALALPEIGLDQPLPAGLDGGEVDRMNQRAGVREGQTPNERSAVRCHARVHPHRDAEALAGLIVEVIQLADPLAGAGSQNAVRRVVGVRLHRHHGRHEHQAGDERRAAEAVIAVCLGIGSRR